MKALMIKDLSVAKELDGRAMSTVRGGGGTLSLFPLQPYSPAHVANTTSFGASQLIGQTNNIVNNTGNDAAFVSGITSTVNPSQKASNTINF